MTGVNVPNKRKNDMKRLPWLLCFFLSLFVGVLVARAANQRDPLPDILQGVHAKMDKWRTTVQGNIDGKLFMDTMNTFYAQALKDQHMRVIEESALQADVPFMYAMWLLGGVLVLLGGSMFFVPVREGTVGAVERWGAYRATFLPGLHFYLPFADKVQEIDTRLLQVQEEVNVKTVDSISLTVAVKIHCKAIPHKVREALYEVEHAGSLLETYLKSSMKHVFREVTHQQAIERIDEVTKQVCNHLGIMMRPYGHEIVEVVFTDVWTTSAPKIVGNSGGENQ